MLLSWQHYSVFNWSRAGSAPSPWLLSWGPRCYSSVSHPDRQSTFFHPPRGPEQKWGPADSPRGPDWESLVRLHQGRWQVKDFNCHHDNSSNCQKLQSLMVWRVGSRQHSHSQSQTLWQRRGLAETPDRRNGFVEAMGAAVRVSCSKTALHPLV